MDYIEICSKCGGRCCFEAKPPISNKRLKILLDNGISSEFVEFGRYRHLKVKEDGY